MDQKITELLSEIDTEATYKDFSFSEESSQLEQLKEGSKVKLLVDQLILRQKELEAQTEEL